jgi:hypothetical protein
MERQTDTHTHTHVHTQWGGGRERERERELFLAFLCPREEALTKGLCGSQEIAFHFNPV